MSHLELTHLGKYQIVGLLGEGAMGAVYRAKDPVLNRDVAIKVMSDAVARDEDLRARFLREAQSAGSLQHPNVITIFDFGEVEGHLFIAMELIEGADLEEILRQRIPLTLAQKLDIAIDVLSALAYAHRRGLVHRDVKPANIRVTEDGRAKIMDFGIVHLESSRMTRTGTALGTPDYMAPEQIVGDKVTPATDIFAAGAVLYELLTTKQPFTAETLHGVMYKIVSEDPPPVEQLLPELPRELSAIVTCALQKQADRRYGSALDMANALTAVRRTVEDGGTATTLSLRATIENTLTHEARRRARRQVLRVALYAGGGTAAVFAIGMAAWLALTPRRTGSSRAVPSETTAARPNAVQTTGHPSVAAATGSVSLSGSTTAPTPAARDSVALAKLRKEVSVYTIAVLGARQRAVDAGAGADLLAPGDAARRQAERLVIDGKLNEAKGLFSYAAALWTEAGQKAHAASTARPATVAPSPALAQKVGATPDRLPGVVPASPPPTPPLAASSPVAEHPSATAQTPPVNPEVEIKAAVQAYARAIDSRDVAEVRRANPGLTDDQQKNFALFFRNVRKLHATFAVLSTDVNGNSAEAQLAGSYDYETADGESHHQQERFVATLKHDGGVWRLAGVR